MKKLLHFLKAQHAQRPWATGLIGCMALIITPLLLPSPLPDSPQKIDLKSLKASASTELKQVFAKHDYTWPPPSRVPPLAPATLPRDLDTLPTGERKTVFIRLLLPLVLAQNRELRRQRIFLRRFFAGERNGEEARSRASALASKYRIDGDLSDEAVQERLLQHVDELPTVMVLAQAAIESGWGTSRFAREGNNLFGHWTYDETEGMVPQRRKEGKTHAVKVYPSLRASVRDYFKTVNTIKAYTSLREQRAKMRRFGAHLDPLRLSEELTKYSERGQAYVEDVKLIISANELSAHLKDVRLASS